ncbi:hypothetical protein ACWDE0_30325 [Streptomyces sp. 900105755]
MIILGADQFEDEGQDLLGQVAAEVGVAGQGHEDPLGPFENPQYLLLPHIVDHGHRPARAAAWRRQVYWGGLGHRLDLADGVVGDVRKPAGQRLDGTTPARVKGITAARPDIRLLFEDLSVGGLNGAGPGDRDEALGLCRCGSRGFEQAGEAVLGLRGRFLMHGDRW